MADILSFLTVPVVAAVAEQIQQERPTLPTFRPRWWFKQNRLDARPVAWSLRNRPEDWEWAHEDYTVRHKPSQHVFWVANGHGFYALHEADCSCTHRSERGKFQRFQQGVFGRAFVHWRGHAGREPVDHQHFAAHFVY